MKQTELSRKLAKSYQDYKKNIDIKVRTQYFLIKPLYLLRRKYGLGVMINIKLFKRKNTTYRIMII